MKNTNKLALLLGLVALLPVAASARTLEQSYIDSCNKGPGIPVPVAVVTPDVTGFDVGQAVQVEFVVDATGHTSDFTIKSASDRDLAAAVMDAVKRWKFEPALRNGAPVATKVILPVRVVAPSRPAGIFAAN
ncbi:MAG TPA: energy transducer TonB [Opitutaceae bacterium]|nr:energy transducer TonB [Opitutaceae bacterium]